MVYYTLKKYEKGNTDVEYARTCESYGNDSSNESSKRSFWNKLNTELLKTDFDNEVIKQCHSDLLKITSKMIMTSIKIAVLVHFLRKEQIDS